MSYSLACDVSELDEFIKRCLIVQATLHRNAYSGTTFFENLDESVDKHLIIVINNISAANRSEPIFKYVLESIFKLVLNLFRSIRRNNFFYIINSVFSKDAQKVAFSQ